MRPRSAGIAPAVQALIMTWIGRDDGEPFRQPGALTQIAAAAVWWGGGPMR